jgi:hypothetical protein
VLNASFQGFWQSSSQIFFTLISLLYGFRDLLCEQKEFCACPNNLFFSHNSSNELAPMGIYKSRHEITKREENQAAACCAAQ